MPDKPVPPTSEGREEVTRLIETTGEGYDCRSIVGIFDVSSMKPADLERQRARRNREFVHAEDYDNLRASLAAAQAERDAAQKAMSYASEQAHLEWTRAEKSAADLKAAQAELTNLRAEHERLKREVSRLDTQCLGFQKVITDLRRKLHAGGAE